MRLAIMQPYLFPYPGYFQLIAAADKFILLDSVNYIKKGWINRNYLEVNGSGHLFTLPLEKVSQNKLIKDCFTIERDTWNAEFLKTIALAYKKCRYFKDVYPLVSDVVGQKEKNISRLVLYSIDKIFTYLSLKTELVPSSSVYEDGHATGQDRILKICLQENASTYLNPPGGRDLYDRHAFAEAGIELKFIKPDTNVPGPDFTYSIIHLLMKYSPEEVRCILNRYHLD